MSCQACCLVKLLPRRPLLHLTPDPLDLFRYSGKNLLPNGSGLKFYNLHQTLNISINVLKSFTDIYCISSARSGFVFFISFTSFFLIVIVPLYPISPYLSSLVLGQVVNHVCDLASLLDPRSIAVN